MSRFDTLRYAVLSLPLAFLGLPLYVYIPPVYGELAGVGLALTGSILLLGRFTDMLTDPLMGLLYDRWRGRFTAFFWSVLGSPLLLLGVWCLFHPQPDTSALEFLGALLMLNLGWTLVWVPYYASGLELEPNKIAQRRLVMSREMAMLLGVLLALLLPVLWPDEDALAVLAVSLCLLLPLALMLHWRLPYQALLTSSDLTKVRRPESSWFEQFRQQSKAMRTLLRLHFFNSLATAIPAGLFLFYSQEVLQLSQAQAGGLMLLYFLSGLAAAPLWLWLARRYREARLWQSSLLLAALAFLPAVLLNAELVWVFVLICVVTGWCVSADVVLPLSLQARLAYLQSQRQGTASHGTALGLWGLINKLALALSAALSLPLLGLLSDYLGRATALPWLYAVLPVAFKLLTWWLLRRHAALVDPVDVVSLSTGENHETVTAGTVRQPERL